VPITTSSSGSDTMRGVGVGRTTWANSAYHGITGDAP
jgi:hypothetical protein